MKNRIITLITLFLIIFSFSCSKYEDGPILSFRSKMKRIEGTWKYESIIYTDQNITVTDDLPKDEFTFSEDGSYSDNLGYTGTWDFSGTVDLTITKSKDTSNIEFTQEIIRLAKKQLWLRSNNIEYHFIH